MQNLHLLDAKILYICQFVLAIPLNGKYNGMERYFHQSHFYPDSCVIYVGRLQLHQSPVTDEGSEISRAAREAILNNLKD